MHPSLRRMLSAVRTCKKSVWRCLKRVRRIPLLRSCFKHKTNEMNATVHDEDLSSTVESQEATVTESSTPPTMKVQYKKILKETVECENSSTSSTLADDDRISATKCEITPKVRQRSYDMFNPLFIFICKYEVPTIPNRNLQRYVSRILRIFLIYYVTEWQESEKREISSEKTEGTARRIGRRRRCIAEEKRQYIGRERESLYHGNPDSFCVTSITDQRRSFKSGVK